MSTETIITPAKGNIDITSGVTKCYPNGDGITPDGDGITGRPNNDGVSPGDIKPYVDPSWKPGI